MRISTPLFFSILLKTVNSLKNEKNACERKRGGAKVCKCKSCRSLTKLQNAYLLQKIRFDTAENAPSTIWQKFALVL